MPTKIIEESVDVFADFLSTSINNSINPLLPGVDFLYSLKTENLKVF